MSHPIAGGSESLDSGGPVVAPILECRGLSKSFGGTLAVDDVSLAVASGEILALLGQNGAGKSTLIKMLAGVHAPDAGEFRLEGAPYDPRLEKGRIAFIHQDLGLVDWMTVAENIAMARGYPRRLGMFVDWGKVEADARRALARVAHDIEPGQRVQELGRTEKSLVAIARALDLNASLIVLDEPTASLPQNEVNRLFSVLHGLKARGVGIIYVSHRLDEVYALADRLAVLRDGKLVAVGEPATIEPADLVRLIIGRPPNTVFRRPALRQQAVVLEASELAAPGIGPLSFKVSAGEIVGLAGLRGAGQEAVGRLLFGCLRPSGGTVTVGGQAFAPGAPVEAIRQGVCLVAGDRNGESIAAGLSVRENMFLNPAACGRGALAWRGTQNESDETRHLGARVGLQPNDPTAAIETLSGGNQQKVVMARWMRVGGRLLVLEDPTAGVDVGAKAEIYRQLAHAVESGLAVLVVSTDVEEVAQICHRALVFRAGRIVGELEGDALDTERLVQMAALPETRAAA